MSAYFLRRLLLMIPTFLGVTIIAFTITRMVPGGPLERAVMQMRMGSTAGGESGGSSISDPTSMIPEDSLHAMKETYNLDKPGYEAYFLWLGDVFRLDFGKSYQFRKPVWELISKRFPISLTFGISGFVLAYLISVPLGIIKALKHGSPLDYTSSALVFIGYSIPGWALGALLLMFLASGRFYEILPLGGIKSDTYNSLPEVVKDREPREKVTDPDFGGLLWNKMSPMSKAIDSGKHMVLPVFCYMIGSFATLTILSKNSLMENLGQDYVRTAFAKGLSPKRVILLHAMRNSLIPLATGLGSALSILMAGSYLIEWVFNIDGVGYLGYTSLVARDYTVVLGILVINTMLILMGNILSDILYAMIDPRIRFE